jgi:hypothetical protein
MERLSSTTRVCCRLVDRPRCARGFRNASMLKDAIDFAEETANCDCCRWGVKHENTTF